MEIGIIGAGSIGTLFSCYLSQNHEVTLFCRTSNQRDLINKNGIIMDGNKFKVHAETSDYITKKMLYIVCVKQYQLEDLINTLNKIDKNIPILFLQNGIGHLNIIDRLLQTNIYLGVVEHGALKSNHTVYHNGKGVTRVARYRGEDELFHHLIEELNQHAFPFLIEDHYEEMLVGKLVVNAIINPLTAVLKVKNGELIENQHYKKMFLHLFNEVADILDLKDKEKMFEHLTSICYNTSNNESSMLRDIKNGQVTEIDGIVGALLQKANLSGKTRPPLLTFLYNAIKGFEIKM